jgi:uncharacterized protein YecT (DUF1311 family)
MGRLKKADFELYQKYELAFKKLKAADAERLRRAQLAWSACRVGTNCEACRANPFPLARLSPQPAM